MVIVLPAATGWRVELDRDERGSLFPDKAQALAFALAWAQSRQPCEVRVYGRFGELDRSIALPEGHYRRPHGSDRRRTQLTIGFGDRRRQERRAPA